MNNRNKALILTGVLLFVIAFAVFIIGGLIAGWDFASFFTSTAFIWICVFIGLYIILVVSVLLYDKINKL